MLDLASPFGKVPYASFCLNLDAIALNAFDEAGLYLMVDGLAVVPSPAAGSVPDAIDVIDEGGRRHRLDATSADAQRIGFTLGSQALRVFKDPARAGGESHHDDPSHAKFARSLVDFEVRMIGDYLRTLMAYSERRMVGPQRLSRVPSQRIRLALVMEKLLMLRVVLEQGAWADDRHARAEVATAIYACVEALIKSAGGRSMLTGGLVQMHATLFLVNQVYLGGDYA